MSTVFADASRLESVEQVNMGSATLFKLIYIVLSLLSEQVWALRDHSRNNHHGRKAYVEYDINSPKSHRCLLGGAQCTVPLPPEIEAPKKNIWDHLFKSQSDAVSRWLRQQPELNLSEKNYIYEVQLMQPNKSDV